MVSDARRCPGGAEMLKLTLILTARMWLASHVVAALLCVGVAL